MLMNYHIGRLVLCSLCVGACVAADLWWCSFCRLQPAKRTPPKTSYISTPALGFPRLKKEHSYISTPPLGLPGLSHSDVSPIHAVCSRYKNLCILQTPGRVGTKSAANSSQANNLQAGEKVFSLQAQFQIIIEYAHDSGNWGKTGRNWC